MCNYKTPYEHAEHLRQEQAVYNKLHRLPIRYYIKSINEEEDIEVTKEEWLESFKGKQENL